MWIKQTAKNCSVVRRHNLSFIIITVCGWLKTNPKTKKWSSPAKRPRGRGTKKWNTLCRMKWEKYYTAFFVVWSCIEKKTANALCANKSEHQSRDQIKAYPHLHTKCYVKNVELRKLSPELNVKILLVRTTSILHLFNWQEIYNWKCTYIL